MMVKERRIEEFTTALSSKAPVPGGGGTAALAGVLGSALGQMVINLTVGKKKYAAVEEELVRLLEQLAELQTELLTLADQDEAVFAPLAEAYRLPSVTDEQLRHKEQVMEEHLVAASLVPLEVIKKSAQVIKILEILSEKGSPLVISDVGVGVQMAKAALLGAVMNVLINTRSMKDTLQARRLEEEARYLSEQGSKTADLVYARVLGTLQN